MNMLKKVVFLPLVLLLAGSLTACTFGSSVDPSLPPAQEVIDAVIKSMSAVSTYQFDSSMIMSTAGETGCASFEMTIDMTLMGAVDIENRQMEADISMGAEIPGQGDMDVRMEMYVIGDTAYMKMDSFGFDPMWVKMEVTDEVWGEMSQMVELVEPYVDLLEAAEVRVTGIDEVAGVDCYVLEVIPDMDQLWELAMQQAEVTDTGMPELTEKLLSEMFRDFSVRQWVSTEMFFITRVMIDMSVELTPEDMGFPGEDGVLRMDIVMYLLAHDYNQPVSIELPPGAENAVDAETGF
ncbi:MAG TPA: hypothetical protein G4O10_00135 [Dehalococcoidia bacterium]|nr:hypothetical protein [Dehalococcoidia bacterium]